MTYKHGYTCDHQWARDDAASKVCLKCHKRTDYDQ